jgi:hypothetical protein
MDDASMIQQMTGCTREEAEKALITHETVLDAIEALIPANPVISGAKYIPQKPTIDNGLDPEQDALCKKGRWLQDRVNAVFSVAHSKILPDLQAEQSALPSAAASVTVPLAVEESVSSQDNPEQTAQPTQQSALPQ